MTRSDQSPPAAVVLDRYPFSLRAGVERVRQAWRVVLHPKFRPEVRLLGGFVPADHGCLDIGANHGRFALELARTGSRVMAFEPLAFNLSVIRPASVLSSRVRVVPTALGETDGTARIYVSLRADGRPLHGTAFVAADDDEARARAHTDRVVRQEVPIRRLDDQDLSWAGPVGFIKMDVEGHEASVIRGGSRVLEEFRPSVLMECSSGEGGLEALRELEARGYLVRDLDLRDQGAWLGSADAVHEGVRAGEKSHDVIAWHGSRGDPPPFEAGFGETRFGS